VIDPWGAAGWYPVVCWYQGKAARLLIRRAVRRKSDDLFPKVAFPDTQEGVGLVEAV
jgi:hypothetical protein